MDNKTMSDSVVEASVQKSLKNIDRKIKGGRAALKKHLRRLIITLLIFAGLMVLIAVKDSCL